MPDKVGQQLGNYRLIRLLGSRGFADMDVEQLLDKRKLSRRTLLWNMAGLALTSGSLAQLTTACGTAPGTSPISQPTASHAPGTTIFTYRGHNAGGHAPAWLTDSKRIGSGRG